jgi:hypothetical protein
VPPTSDPGQTQPPNGWELPREEAPPAADVLGQLAEAFGEFIPDDLRRRLAQAIRELLVALRALIDWLVARLEQRRGGEPAEVRDIPIL